MTDEEIGWANTQHRVNKANDEFRPHGIEIHGVVRDDKAQTRAWVVTMIGSDKSLCTENGLNMKAAIQFARHWINK
jgi:hypothetical protein